MAATQFALNLFFVKDKKKYFFINWLNKIK